MTTDPTTPPAAGSGWGQRWAVEHRPKGSRKWATILTAGSEQLAWDAVFDLMGTGKGGDWRVTRQPLQQPPPNATIATQPGSAAGSVAIGGPGRT